MAIGIMDPSIAVDTNKITKEIHQDACVADISKMKEEQEICMNMCKQNAADSVELLKAIIKLREISQLNVAKIDENKQLSILNKSLVAANSSQIELNKHDIYAERNRIDANIIGMQNLLNLFSKNYEESTNNANELNQCKKIANKLIDDIMQRIEKIEQQN